MCGNDQKEVIKKAQDVIIDCLRQPATSGDLRNCLKKVATILSLSKDDLQETKKTNTADEEIYTNT